MERNLTFLPVLDERPIERGQKEVLAASANEDLLYFGEIVVIIA